MKRRIIASAILIWMAIHPAKAQQKSANAQAGSPQSVQLNAGTQGVGAAYNYGVLPQLALRLGFDIEPISAKNIFYFSDFNSTSNLKATFSNIHLLADYTPFKNSAWFRLVGGLGYFMSAKGTLNVQPMDNYTYGDIQLTPEQVGKLTFDADWHGVAPYFGVGFFRMFPRNKFNVNIDLGSYYLKQPEAHITGTGSLQGNATQTAQFQENIKDYRWLPVLQLNFSYKL